MWPLAVLTITCVGAADLFGACRVAATAVGLPGEAPTAPTWTDRLPALPRGARIVLAGLALALSGSQAALYSVLGCRQSKCAIL